MWTQAPAKLRRVRTGVCRVCINHGRPRKHLCAGVFQGPWSHYVLIRSVTVFSKSAHDAVEKPCISAPYAKSVNQISADVDSFVTIKWNQRRFGVIFPGGFFGGAVVVYCRVSALRLSRG